MNAHTAMLAHPEFADIDRHFASFIGGYGTHGTDGTYSLPAIAAALLSRNVRGGHICLDLAAPAPSDQPLADFPWPTLAQWRTALAQCAAIGPADPEGTHPIVLEDSGLLYLRRYWDYERSLAANILARCTGAIPTDTGARQQLAIETARARRFVVISGGPGTGKTTTVLKILQELMAQPNGAQLRIALAAPTGKAAARLQETLRVGIIGHPVTHSPEDEDEDEPPRPTASTASTASTLHRLLGGHPGSVYFKHNAKNPLPFDLVVVDEASMIALPTMAKLLDALPVNASIILLGDRFQLASVEPGAVLGDIADAASVPGSPLHGSLVVLEKNYRFGNESAIFALCNAVRDGNADVSLAILRDTRQAEISSFPVPAPKLLPDALRPRIIEGFSAYLQKTDPADALREFQKFRVLCAVRSGPYGVEDLNRAIEEILRKEGLIEGPQNIYRGLPIMVTRNNHELRLYNGDIGILLPEPPTSDLRPPTSGSLVAWFIGEDGALRHIPPARLPAYEPAFAMTVHKSQGSEFEQVLLILPNKESPVLTRELIYTGLTRARTKLEVWFEEPVLRAAIGSPIQRASGLAARLRNYEG